MGPRGEAYEGLVHGAARVLVRPGVDVAEQLVQRRWAGRGVGGSRGKATGKRGDRGSRPLVGGSGFREN